MKMEFDMTDFNRVMKKYLSVNRRENAELINKKASQFTAVAVNRDARRRWLAFTLKEKTKEARQLRRHLGRWRRSQIASM
jgi:hypothetical protein